MLVDRSDVGSSEQPNSSQARRRPSLAPADWPFAAPGTAMSQGKCSASKCMPIQARDLWNEVDTVVSMGR